jgi:hypothetical protein
MIQFATRQKLDDLPIFQLDSLQFSPKIVRVADRSLVNMGVVSMPLFVEE